MLRPWCNGVATTTNLISVRGVLLYDPFVLHIHEVTNGSREYDLINEARPLRRGQSACVPTAAPEHACEAGAD
ncbi:hypothetical protein NDU88_003759 [Pleurodeles waltl]|uniref:Uncharacterized protein n=1 Tax=Pleurodeles waltl TaxID=8319 RepID=A0AAV7W711_PLEWA|nr:hypothetical protein NDU88_003759 [Pleurodeles waltl]